MHELNLSNIMFSDKVWIVYFIFDSKVFVSFKSITKNHNNV